LIVRSDECERILPLFPTSPAAHCLAKPLGGFHHRFDKYIVQSDNPQYRPQS
jgi:hypothetical protein